MRRVEEDRMDRKSEEAASTPEATEQESEGIRLTIMFCTSAT
jgi:hypothetical protein